MANDKTQQQHPTERHFETPPPLTDDDLAQIAAMLADYDAHTDSTDRAPNGTPTRLYIADDLVSQALPALLAEVARLRAKGKREAALVEIAQAVADGEVYHDSKGGMLIVATPDAFVAKARALLATEGDGA